MYEGLSPEFAQALTAMSKHPPLPPHEILLKRKIMETVVTNADGAVKAACPDLDERVALQTHLAPGLGDDPEVPILHYTLKDAQPSQPPAAAILNVHGGGMIFGSAKTMDAGSRRYALEGGVQVFDVEYRLAPEHPYPAAHSDVWAAFVWLHAHAAEFGVDPKRIALLGDSGGGCIATAVAIHAAKQGYHVAKLFLTAPMLDDRTGRDMLGQKTEFTWKPEDNEVAWNAMLGGSSPDFKEGAIPPVPARVADLRGLAPTLLQCGAADIFLDETLAFGNALAKQGVDVKTFIYAGAPHGFENIIPSSPISIRAAKDRFAIVREL